MDTILINGNIVTLDSYGTTVEAVAIQDGKIVGLGSNHMIAALADKKTRKIDLRGKTVLPGFIDAHNHMIMFGLRLTAINCFDGPIASIADLKAEIARRAVTANANEWITGWGYDNEKFSEKRHPTRWDFDEAAPHHPVLCDRICAHMLVVNSKALQLAGITRDTPDPVGGIIYRDANGEPNGLLRDTAMNLIKKIVPIPAVDTIKEAIVKASAIYNTYGITGVHEAGAGFTIPGPYEVRAYQQAAEEKLLTLRVYMMLYPEHVHELLNIGLKTGFGNEFLRIGSFKMFLDGNIVLKGAAVDAPYADGSTGATTETQESLNEKFLQIHRAGFQIAIHSIGDRATRMVLTAYENAQRTYPRHNHRHRIEHLILSTPQILQQAKKLEVLPIIQPGFMYYNGETWIASLGEERVNRQGYLLRNMIEEGLSLAGSSDCPCIPAAPLKSIEAAVRRKVVSGRQLAPEQALSVDQALRMYTNNAAYASFEEDIKGSIEVGKLADLVVLDHNPYRVLPNEIGGIPVAMTIVNGRVVYESN